jgi:hypothetical protein
MGTVAIVLFILLVAVILSVAMSTRDDSRLLFKQYPFMRNLRAQTGIDPSEFSREAPQKITTELLRIEPGYFNTIDDWGCGSIGNRNQPNFKREAA